MASHRRKWSGLAIFILCLILPGRGEVIQEFEISEGAPVGTSIGFIGRTLPGSSHTPPPPPYLIVPSPGSPVDSDLNIDQSSGEILTRLRLDCETRDSYSLVAIPFVGENIRVIIRVKDENDNAPEFPTSFMHVEFPENTARDVKRTLQPAKDKDLGIYNTQRYIISAGNVNSAFRLSSHRERDGVLYLDLQVNGFLDRETIPGYSLLVEAFDGGVPPLKGSMTINITITDQNDNAPIWQFPRSSTSDSYMTGGGGDMDDMNLSQSRYFATVPENATLGTSVLQVFATDIDEGPNGQVVYSINRRQTDKDSVFRIDRNTGIIYVNGPLDYETKEVHELVVVAGDCGIQPLETTVFVTIRVLDLNDNQMEINVSFFSGDSDGSPPKVSDKALPGEFVARMSIIDPDTKQEYHNVSISLENGDGYFGLETVNSVVYLVVGSKKLDRENKPSFTLTLLAKDKTNPYLNASSTFTIYVEDDNDSPPSFEVQVYHASLVETAEIGSDVVQVKARDDDYGENARITYQLVNTPETHSTWFEINEETGVITTKSHVDCEVDPTPVLTVLAKDHGRPPLTGSATVVVHLIDTNDTPIFNQGFYNASFPETVPYGTRLLKDRVEVVDSNDKRSEGLFVPSKLRFKAFENATIGTIIGRIPTTTDADMGKPQIFYRAVNDVDNEFFEVHATSGAVVVSSRLNYETIPHFTIQVEAVLQTHDSFSEAIVTIEILVLDVNDERPKFAQDPITTLVSESIHVGSTVWNVTAVDSDSGANGVIHYSIAQQYPSAKFRINMLTGMLHLQSPLDYEKCSSYVLIVTATDQASNIEDQLMSSVTVRIEVKDENDNAPVFTSPSSVEIYELEPLKTEFHTVIATDADSVQYGQVSYKIISGNDEGLFSLNQDNGRLSLAKPLKRDVKRYSLNISAFDGGSPSQVAYQTLSISVKTDRNHAPRFSSPNYEAKVSENCAIGTHVIQVSTPNPAYGRNGTIFTIPDGMSEGKFAVNPQTGVLTVVGPLDREAKSHYSLEIYLVDPKHGYILDKTSVVIHVLDENDNAPNFHDTCTDLTVPENNELGTFHVFIAEDLDIGKNCEVTFIIVAGNAENMFNVDLHTGRLSGRPLDRERKSQYNIVVVAQDQGSPPKKTSCNMTIYVDDENDSPIVFIPPTDYELQKLSTYVHSPNFRRLATGQAMYSASIPENIPVGTRILRVQANDGDTGVNSIMKYSLNNESYWHFTIDNSTGEIFTAGTLDREKLNSYVFEVAATDGGLYDSRTSTASVHLTITDYNDNRPKFRENPVVVKTSPSVAPGQNIAQIVAWDNDEGRNSEVIYRLDSHQAEFSVQELSGQISLARNLNAEREKIFHLKVIAQDQGSPSLTSTGLVVVQVGELEPQHTLRFQESLYEVKLHEDSPVGTQVSKVHAQRGDGKAVRVKYAIIGGNEDGIFAIDPSAGIITVKDGTKLDREGQDKYSLLITGRTEDSKSLLSHTVVRVSLLDINDNYPRFTQQWYIASVWEGNTKGTFVSQVTATDADEGSNANVVYHIIEGNQDNAFIIEPPFSGIVKTNIVLDREILDEYRLTIIATDEGSPQMTGTCYLRVNVIDIQDQSPIFPPQSVITVKEDASVGTMVTTIVANDVDTNPTLVYSFTEHGNPEGLFSIGKYTGRVTLVQPLDYETSKTHPVTIQVSDSVHTATTTLTVNVLDQNDHPPEFLQKVYRIILSDGIKIGGKIGFVNASDKDTGNNGRTKYSLRASGGHRYSPKFLRIDEDTGVIYLNSSVNFHREEPFSQLIVIASDYGQPSLSSEASLWIELRPPDSHILKFSQPKYRAVIDQHAKPGTLVTQLSVDRIDQITNGVHYHYSIVSGNDDGHFSINSHTGQILLTKVFGANSPTTFALVISVDCVNMEQCNSVAELSIEVLPRSSLGPKFDKSKFKVTVSENKVVGSTLLKIHASDPTSNGTFQYEITSGNEENIVELNRQSGVLVLKRSLDFDSHNSNYHIVVKAMEPDNPSRPWNFTTVDIVVDDENDNEPKFLFSTYVGVVGENEAIGTIVCKLKATDLDKGIYGKLQYSIMDGEGKDKFSIASSTGIVTTKAVLDYETKSRYYLTIRANDIGGKSSTTKLQIDIESKDEFVPQFLQKNYRFEVPQNAEPGYIFGQVEATDRDRGPDGIISYKLQQSSPDFAINSTNGFLILKTVPNKGINSTLTIIASSGRDGSKYSYAYVEAILGDALRELEMAASSTTNWVLGVLVATLLVLLIIFVTVFFLHLKNKKKTAKGKGEAFNGPNFDTMDYAPTTMRMGTTKQGSLYGSHYGNVLNVRNNERRRINNAISELSDQSNSASSGRGSAEDGEEDEEICMINESSLVQQQLHGVLCQDEDDNGSQSSAKNTQEYLARLGIKGDERHSNVDNLHLYDRKQGDVDLSGLIYSQIPDDLHSSAIEDKSNVTYNNVPRSVTGSLSSVVHNNEEELAGTYNWNYLLDWGPQYQPLAHVFSEIAHLKEGSSRSEPTYCGILPNEISSSSSEKGSSHRNASGSVASARTGGNCPRTGPLPPLPVLPRSPIPNDMNFSGIISPNFKPSIFPLANRCPSPLGNVPSSNIRTSQIHEDYRSDSEMRM